MFLNIQYAIEMGQEWQARANEKVDMIEDQDQADDGDVMY